MLPCGDHGLFERDHPLLLVAAPGAVIELQFTDKHIVNINIIVTAVGCAGEQIELQPCEVAGQREVVAVVLRAVVGTAAVLRPVVELRAEVVHDRFHAACPCQPVLVVFVGRCIGRAEGNGHICVDTEQLGILFCRRRPENAFRRSRHEGIPAARHFRFTQLVAVGVHENHFIPEFFQRHS